MARPCDRPGCGTKAAVRIIYITAAEDLRIIALYEIDGIEASPEVERFTGCTTHAREVWVTLHGRLRTFRRIA